MLATFVAGGRRRAASLVAVAAICAVLTSGQVAGAQEAPPGAHAAVAVGKRVVFVGDYETGDFSQWETCQSAVRNSSCAGVGTGDRSMQILPAPEAHQGSYAARSVAQTSRSGESDNASLAPTIKRKFSTCFAAE